MSKTFILKICATLVFTIEQYSNFDFTCETNILGVTGDSKDTTREKARLVLLKLMEKGSMTPQQLLDKLHTAFSHKNAKLREEALILLSTTLDEYVSTFVIKLNY